MLDFSRYVQIATVDADGLPSVRTVVMREIFEDKAIVVVTDKRSEKLNHLQNKHSPFAHNKAPSSSSSTDQKTNTDMTDAFDGDMTFTTKPCEVCWYFSLTKEQFRIRCKVSMRYMHECVAFVNTIESYYTLHALMLEQCMYIFIHMNVY